MTRMQDIQSAQRLLEELLRARPVARPLEVWIDGSRLCNPAKSGTKKHNSAKLTPTQKPRRGNSAKIAGSPPDFGWSKSAISHT